jgi:large subunit ribosomal protein L4e
MRRYAVVSALAASAVSSVVESRGHVIADVQEIPLVLGNFLESVKTTKEAKAILATVGAQADVERVIASKAMRAGAGKMRNRRFRQRLGPMVVYNEDNGVVKAFRNIPGVQLFQVDRLNLLNLAPGGHLGRFIIWSQAAFEKLEAIYGTREEAAQFKTGYKLPAAMVATPSLTRLINSDELQSVLRGAHPAKEYFHIKRNPLVNKHAAKKLQMAVRAL